MAKPKHVTLVGLLADVQEGAAGALESLPPGLDFGLVDSFHLTWEGPGSNWTADLWTVRRTHFRERGSTPKYALRRLVRSIQTDRQFVSTHRFGELFAQQEGT